MVMVIVNDSSPQVYSWPKSVSLVWGLVTNRIITRTVWFLQCCDYVHLFMRLYKDCKSVVDVYVHNCCMQQASNKTCWSLSGGWMFYAAKRHIHHLQISQFFSC